MIKRFLLSTSFFIFLIAGGILYLYLFNPKQGSIAKTQLIQISGEQLEIEIADTPIRWAKGLSGRDGLAENRGMLFIFPDFKERQFWMKNMKFPIDILWLRADTIVGFEENVSPPIGGEDSTIVVSLESVDRVLEVRAGLVQKLGVQIGDEVVFLRRVADQELFLE